MVDLSVLRFASAALSDLFSETFIAEVKSSLKQQRKLHRRRLLRRYCVYFYFTLLAVSHILLWILLIFKRL
jgi:hypothetical protein